MNLINYFLELVQIDSTSGNESKVADYLKKWLEKEGFAWSEDKLGTILAKKGGGSDPVLLCAHMDTVEPGHGIKPIIKGDKICSDETTILGADNKASIAAIMSAVQLYKGDKSIELLFTVKEETGGGVENFPLDSIKSKICYIFDATGPVGNIISSSPYIINFDVKFIGKSAHSSNPKNGLNTILPMSEFIKKVGVGYKDGKKTTLNIGLVTAGSGVNTIPGEAIIKGEVRSYDKRLYDECIKYVDNLAKSIAEKYGVKYVFSKNGFCPGYNHAKDDVDINNLKKVLKVFGINPKMMVSHEVTDANPLNYFGIKTINITSGMMNAHTVNEFITINDLELLEKVIYQIIINL